MNTNAQIEMNTQPCLNVFKDASEQKRCSRKNVEKIISFSRPIGSILLGNCFRSYYANVIQTLNRKDFHSPKNPLKESTDSARYCDRIDHSGNEFRDQRMYYLLPLYHK